MHLLIAFDVQAVCAGFIYAVDVADAMLEESGRRALVIGAEFSQNYLIGRTARPAFFLMVLVRSFWKLSTGTVILASGLRCCMLGTYRDILYVDDGPSSNETSTTMRMEGKKVMRHAIEKLAAVMDDAGQAI